MLQIIVLAGLGLLTMLSEVFGFKKYAFYLTLVGLGASIGLSFIELPICFFGIEEMFREDNFSKSFILVTSILFLIWLFTFRKSLNKEESTVEFVALTCFAMVGGFMMIGFNHFVMLFLGIEILSIPVYILAGASKSSLKSNEAAFKYFLMGAFASAFLLLGITLIYGATGSFDLTKIAALLASENFHVQSYFGVGILLVVFAMLFKISAVPFHFWTPDVYEGAPTVFTGFMSTLVKVFATTASFKLFDILLRDALGENIWVIFIVISLTLMVGNILGAIQNNPKRTLAYSSIAHAGFMLISILVGGEVGVQSLLYYGVSYGVASILAFYILSLSFGENTELTFEDLSGLAKRNPWLGFGLTVSVLSMGGIPPLSGFFAKYFVFNAAYEKGFYLMVVLAIFASLISVYYYMRFAYSIYAQDSDNAKIEISLLEKVTILFLMLAIVLIGVFPDHIMSLIKLN